MIRLLKKTILLPLLILCAGACNSDKGASIIGKVTYNGESIDGGQLNLISKAGISAVAAIDSAGAYHIDGSIVPGEYSVYINPPMPPQLPPGTPMPPAPEFKVPAKFRDPQSSGMTITVKAGKNNVPVAFQD